MLVCLLLSQLPLLGHCASPMQGLRGRPLREALQQVLILSSFGMQAAVMWIVKASSASRSGTVSGQAYSEGACQEPMQYITKGPTPILAKFLRQQLGSMSHEGGYFVHRSDVLPERAHTRGKQASRSGKQSQRRSRRLHSYLLLSGVAQQIMIEQ